MRQPILLAILTAALLAACSSTPPKEEPKAPVEEPSKPPVASGGDISPSPTIGEWDVRQLKNPNSILSKRSVYFNFDEYVIKDEFKPLVEAHGKFLVHNASMKMLVQGNADERGSREYNLALGQKRAEAVKKSLLLQGGKEDQVEAVSLGKEKPRCTEHSDDCWAQNRRDDILYSGEY